MLEYREDNNFRYALAHELGHFFGLLHTKDRYPGIREDCNRGYGRWNGSTLDGSNRLNVMDYDPGNAGTITGWYLNDCQSERAAKQRRLYMTGDGKGQLPKATGRPLTPLGPSPGPAAQLRCRSRRFIVDGDQLVGRGNRSGLAWARRAKSSAVGSFWVDAAPSTHRVWPEM